MKNIIRKVVPAVVVVSVIMSLTGCTNWKKKYQGLEVEHENLQGLYETCVGSLEVSSGEKSKLGRELSQRQQTIEDLQRQIERRNISPGQASGFGEDMNVTFDSVAGTITVTLPNSILFSPGVASLRKTTSTKLNRVLNVLRERYSDKAIDVIGHTDSDPIKKSKWKDNWELSSQRSLSVLRYLTKHGISDENILAVGAGSSRPIASNATSSGKGKNRRVEIVVHMR